MTLYDDAVTLLADWAAPTPAQEALRQRYAVHLAQHPDGLTRGCYPDHVTASTLVISADGTQVLLTLHAKAQQWFQFGGHVEAADATLRAAATREAEEESGLVGLQLDPRPVQLSEHAVPFCDPRGGVHHLDVRFVAVAPADAVHAVSEESLDVRWWPADALPDAQPDMIELVELARRRLAQSTSPSAVSAPSPGGGSSRAPAE